MNILKNKAFFLTGIGTGVGKTVTAAILTEALKADYWKPIQAGDIENSDTKTVQNLISNTNTTFFPERHLLHFPASPHYAAKMENKAIKLSDFTLPKTNNTLVVEGAGGLMVPINEKECIIDLIDYLQLPVVLVVQNYLGAINHALLSINALKAKNIEILGIIFNGDNYNDNQEIIVKMTHVPVLANLKVGTIIDREWIEAQAKSIQFL